MPLYLHEISDDTIGKALSSSLFIQEREEPASRRQAYHTCEESLLPAQSLSVCHARTARPLNELTYFARFKQQRKNQVATQKMSKSGFSLNDRKSKFSLIVEHRFRNTNFRPNTIEEVSRNWIELLSLKEVKLTIFLRETNNFEETNNFFMNKNKIGIFVKLCWNVSMRWKNWSDFKGLHSMNFREEDWLKIETLSLNSQPKIRNYMMKLFVWMVRKIL